MIIFPTSKQQEEQDLDLDHPDLTDHLDLLVVVNLDLIDHQEAVTMEMEEEAIL